MRLSRARFMPPRVVLWVTGAALLIASLLRPALSGPPADLGRLPGTVPIEHAGPVRSQEEIEKLPRHMRPTSPERAQTGRRVHTVLRVELDGRVLLERRYSPGGLRGDGPTFAYEELAVRPGRHLLHVTLADESEARPGATPPRRWWLEEEVAIAGGQALLVEFSEDTGLVRRD
jgi:hypothetical protein